MSMSTQQRELHTNDGEHKAINLPPCPNCGSRLEAAHVGNSRTKSQKLKVKCSRLACRVERTEATMRGGIDDLIQHQERAWQAAQQVPERDLIREIVALWDGPLYCNEIKPLIDRARTLLDNTPEVPHD